MNQVVKLTTLFFATTLALTGCNTLKNFTKKNSDTVLTAQASDSEYYAQAMEAIDKRQFTQAALALNNLRTFYPTSIYAEQALLDLIYVYHNAKDFEAVGTAATQFISSYPTSQHVDYALYARGVTYMHGSPKIGHFFKLNQSERDTSYLRLAFADLQILVTHYPSSIYAPDAALRMTDIYNQFAHHELQAARWYVKRKAYVAAANRAKWVFNYYPQSTSVPEAIAILAHANEQLGLIGTSNEYKTLLKINYPQYLNGNMVILPNASKGWANKTLSLVTLGRYGDKDTLNHANTTNYQGNIYPQIIKDASVLRLPDQPNDVPNGSEYDTDRIQIGLDLPDGKMNMSNQTP